jgi:hypothetical protein
MCSSDNEKGANMKLDNRVLGRMGARQLSVEETERVAGSLQVHTNICSAPLTSALGDADGCGGDLDR